MPASLSFDEHAPSCGAVEAAENIEQRGFSTPACTDNANHLSIGNGDIKTLQSLHFNGGSSVPTGRAEAVDFYKVLANDQRF